MRIIFYGYSGVHSAVVAAAALLGKCETGSAAQLQLSEVPLFGSSPVKYRLIFHGTDCQGNEIFSLGVGWEMVLIPRAIRDFLIINGLSDQEIRMINTAAPLGPLIRIGELLACYGLQAIGNYLVQKGLEKKYGLLIKYVINQLETGE